MLKSRALIVIAFIVGIVAILYFTTRPVEQKTTAARIAELKCPEAYSTADEKSKAFNEFFEDYSDEYPVTRMDATAITAGRIDFLISHQCTSTLMNLGYDGKSPIDDMVRTKLIIYSMQNNQATSTL